MNLLIVFFFLAVLANSAFSASPTRTVLNVNDFGANPSLTNNYEALKAAVEAAKATEGPVELRFEPDAVYRAAAPDSPNPQDQFALLIRGAKNLVLNGQGATLVVTNPEQGALCTEDSSRIEVKNLIIDYDPVPYTQGRIHALNFDEDWFELKVDEGFMEPDQPCFARSKDQWGMAVRTQADGKLSGDTAVFSKQWKKTGDNLWRFTAFKPYPNHLWGRDLKVGEAYIHKARNWAQTVAAKNCDEILWENITVYSAPNLAFYPHRTSNHTIRDCHVKIKEGRIFSSNADGIHMRGSRGHVLIDGCSVEGMGDDGINVHSSALSVQKQPKPNQVVVKSHTFSVQPDDELVIVRSSSAQILGKARVVAAQEESESWLITLDRDLPVLQCGDGFSDSDNLYNLSESANPFTIRNCRFNNFRGRGILVSAHGGLIENNVFNNPRSMAILLGYEAAKWGEGPIAHNIVIRDNLFHGNQLRKAPITVELHIKPEAIIPGNRPFQNLTIEGNRFVDCDVPAVALSYARDVQILNNEVASAGGTPLSKVTEANVALQDCANVVINGVALQDTNPKQVDQIQPK